MSTLGDALDWDRIDDFKHADEAEAARPLAGLSELDEPTRDLIKEEAVELVRRARKLTSHKGMMESFLEEFGLSNKEGLALMCLAEALLRVPDANTADKLIAEKLASGDWGDHMGQSDNVLVNASTWGLMLTGKLTDVSPEIKRDIGAFMRGMVRRLGEPVIRSAMMQAMRIMGEQFVVGRTIKTAMERAKKLGPNKSPAICSFDMLGEGARTAADAERYFERYKQAIIKVGELTKDKTPETGSGISVKLSALHPRFDVFNEDRVMDEMYPRIKELAILAAEGNMNLCLDAEEADRLVLSLKVLDRLTREEELGDWTGLGLAVQAYQKRALAVIERIARLSRRTGRRIMVRLVKGAYWDTEIKHAQQLGYADFPVWTRKSTTDLSYLACARAMLEYREYIYPQFATHNAHSVAAIRAMGERMEVTYEFQRLHGMGEALFAAVNEMYGPVPCRVYAPVGEHEDLLPYLVRRLLENGANTSFVNAFLDADVPPEVVAGDPFEEAGENPTPHDKIPAPVDLFGPNRKNSRGIDLTRYTVRRDIALAGQHMAGRYPIKAGPIVAGKSYPKGGRDVFAPHDPKRKIGTVADTSEELIGKAYKAASGAQKKWDLKGGAARGSVLRAVANALEVETENLVALMAVEAGKSLPDGVAEVREAVDFLRYYAHQAETEFAGYDRLPGPAGETNQLRMMGRGVFTCISPWNFPLAIFTGQIAAALAAGNTVLAKPAEQTPLTAFVAVRIFHDAGVPVDALHLLPGPGETVGAQLTELPGLAGVAFTGSTDVARIINRTLAAKDGPIPVLIAETGGLNGMFVDSSALREQVIDDVVMSAFNAAGQRCSALRLLFVPESTSKMLIAGIEGAMDELRLGDPADPSTDIGPVIDDEAKQGLEKHLANLPAGAEIIKQMDIPEHLEGSFFPPTLIRLKSLDGIDKEVFGPILHVVTYKRKELPKLMETFAAKGYGLTLGIHSRLESFAEKVRRAIPAGNVYVNRNIIGAVVGVQPFGGQGLSGTGPKAGGPHYLHRFATERALTINVAAQGGDPELLNLD